jgi:hypothetical protein
MAREESLKKEMYCILISISKNDVLILWTIVQNISDNDETLLNHKGKCSRFTIDRI